MTRLSGEAAVPPDLRGAIVALGNFDGFHRGHQAVVGRAIDRARAEGRPAIVATFDPHPARFFVPDAEPFRLTTLDQREELFRAAGADAMLVWRFDAALAALDARAFVAERLVGLAGIGGAVTGGDFTFGRKRGGDVATLAELGAEFGFSTDIAAAVNDGDAPVSSTRIRAALKAGDPRGAAALLTRPFAIRGIVIHGDKRGREIGYPTANLELGPYLRPAYGIYAVRVTLPDGRVVGGAANLGIRPSFDPPRELLEPYLFDFDGDLYGQEIEVALVDFIRAEAKFDGLEALKTQMADDCARARAMLEA